MSMFDHLTNREALNLLRHDTARLNGENAILRETVDRFTNVIMAMVVDMRKENQALKDKIKKKRKETTHAD